MFCPQCGKAVDDGAKFCPYCGKPMPQEKVLSSRSFFSKGQNDPDNQNDTPNHPPKGIVIGGIAAIAIIIVVVLALVFGGKTASEISTVQNGYLGEYTDMNVKEVLDSYYGFLYQTDGKWISGESANAKDVTMVQVEYSSELLGTATLQFTMLDEQCFEITYIDDPMETIKEASDVLAVLNKVYIAAYESKCEQEELAEVEAQLLERLTEVNATSVRYGASADYDGDRSQLYQLFGDTQLDMSATELLDLYDIVDYTGQPNQGTANTDFSWIEGDYESTTSGTGVLKLSLWFDEYRPWESPMWGICFRIYFAESTWNDSVNDYVYSEFTNYEGKLSYQGGDGSYLVFSDSIINPVDGEQHFIEIYYDGEYFTVGIDINGEIYDFYGP